MLNQTSRDENDNVRVPVDLGLKFVLCKMNVLGSHHSAQV